MKTWVAGAEQTVLVRDTEDEGWKTG